MLADAQIDDVQLQLFDVRFDLIDVPRDQFLVAGDAWRLCRDGDADWSPFSTGWPGSPTTPTPRSPS
jgi:hypothetical protein